MTIDDKWIVVKDHYEKIYHIHFKKRLSDNKVEFLHDQLMKLNRSMHDYIVKHSTRVHEFINPQGASTDCEK